MGRFLAELHLALRNFPSERVPARSIDIDPVATLRGIDRLLAVIRDRPVLDAVDRYALERLESRRVWIECSGSAALPDLSSLGRQVIHGDYQETNLFFDAGKVSAIIDWDQAYTAPRAWEVVRTLHLAFHLCLETCRAFLSAYRAELPLEPGDLDEAWT
jgi:homoserine kinase type II